MGKGGRSCSMPELYNPRHVKSISHINIKYQLLSYYCELVTASNLFRHLTILIVIIPRSHASTELRPRRSNSNRLSSAATLSTKQPHHQRSLHCNNDEVLTQPDHSDFELSCCLGRLIVLFRRTEASRRRRSRSWR